MIEGKRIRLRPFEEADASRYLAWVNQEQTASLLTRALPVSTLEHQKWYESLMARSDAVVFSAEVKSSGLYVGNVWLWGIHWVHRNAELRILIGEEEARGQGYGTEACQLLLEFAFRKLGLAKVYLYVVDLNPRARRAFEKAGFVTEGTLSREFFVDGQFRDGFRMAAFPS